MKCENIFCNCHGLVWRNHCNQYLNMEMKDCKAKQRFDRFVLLNGLKEIDPEENELDK